MYSNGPRGILRDGEKPLHDRISRSGAIDKEQILVVKPDIGEPPSIVHPLVEPHDCAHTVLSEVGEVVLGSVKGVAILNHALVVGASKCKEFACRGYNVHTMLLDMYMYRVIILITFPVFYCEYSVFCTSYALNQL